MGIETALIGSAVIGGVGSYMAGQAQKEAASEASAAQVKAAQLSIAEQRRQFDEMKKTLAPYVGAGETALSAQMALAGLGGVDVQQQAVQNLATSPLFQAQVQQGEEALLQQASATGGIRGGNIQAALAQYRPAMLQQEINQQYARLGGLTSIGQASAAGQAAAGMQGAANIGNLLTQQGAAQAGAALAQGQAAASQYGGIASSLAQPLSMYGTLGIMKQMGAF